MCAQKEQSNRLLLATPAGVLKPSLDIQSASVSQAKSKSFGIRFFCAWGCAFMIHSASELQMNTFRLLHGKIAASLLAFFQKLHVETLFPEAVAYSLLPSEHCCILCSCRKDLGCPERMGYNQHGQGRKCVGVLSSSVATSLRSCHWASLSKTETKEQGGIVLLRIRHACPQNRKTTSFRIASSWCIPQPLIFKCFYNGIFSTALTVCTHSRQS